MIMRVYEKIKLMDIDELVDWLDEHCMFDNAPWWEWWDEHYCNKCEAIIRTDDDGYEREYGYCELHHKCRFFEDMDNIPDVKQIIKMWLLSESD